MKFKTFVIFAVTFIIGLTVAMYVVKIGEMKALYTLAATAMIVIILLRDVRRFPRALRIALISGIIVSIGTFTTGQSFGHAYTLFLFENQKNEIAIHLFAGFVGILILFTWAQERLREMR